MCIYCKYRDIIFVPVHLRAINTRLLRIKKFMIINGSVWVSFSLCVISQRDEHLSRFPFMKPASVLTHTR